jgi:hypothetical protein
MSITLKPQFLKVALIAVMIAGMPVSHAKSPAQADKVLRVAFLHLMMVLIWSKPLIFTAAMLPM